MDIGVTPTGDQYIKETINGYMVIVDGYRLSSVLDYSSLKGYVEVFYNKLVHVVNKLLRDRDISLAYIITTSDASIERLKVGGSKERYVLMWNIPRESIEKLAENIGVDKELAWKPKSINRSQNPWDQQLDRG